MGSKKALVFAVVCGLTAIFGLPVMQAQHYPIPSNAPAGYPVWWFTNGTIIPSNPTNAAPIWPSSYPASDDYSVINQGQLKNIATAASAHLQTYLPAAVLNLSNALALQTLVSAWTTNPSTNADNYAVVNQGQLKALAGSFYDVLGSGSYTAGIGVQPTNWISGSYPWSTNTNSSDPYAVANIGQAKYLFSFDLSAPTNQVPPWWSTYYGLTNVVPTAQTPAGNGLTFIQAFQQGANPTNYYSQGTNTITPVVTIVSGNNQNSLAGVTFTSPLIIQVNGGSALSNAPVTFTVSSGSGLIATSSTGSPTYSSSVSLRTTANGQALVYLQDANVGLDTITVTAGTAIPVLFSETNLPAPVQFSAANGTYYSPQAETLISATAGAAIYYTTNGSTPTTNSTLYTGAINVSAPTVINAIAVKNGIVSTVGSVTLNVINPVLTIVSGNNQMLFPGITAPLVFQISNTNGLALTNLPVSFSASGTGLIGTNSAGPFSSSNQILSDTNGQIQIYVLMPTPATNFAVTATVGPTNAQTNVVCNVNAVSGLALWFKADSGLAINGNNVTAWTNLANNTVVTQATTTNQPTLTTNVVNGYPALQFNGSQSLASTNNATNYANLNAGMTIITVAMTTNSSSTGQQYGLYLGSGGTGSNRAIGYYQGRELIDSGGGVFAQGISIPNTNTFVIEGWTLNTNRTAVTFYRNGAQVTNGTLAGMQNLGAGVAIGSTWQGDIAEVLVYDHLLSTNEMAQANLYLANKYGFPISAPAPSITPNGGSNATSMNVSITGNPAPSVIRYTQDGSTLTSSSPIYSNSIILTQSAQISAGIYLDTNRISPVSTAQFYVADTYNLGISDAWQNQYFGSVTNLNPNAQTPAGNGLTYLQAYQQGANPINYYTQGTNPIIPTLNIISGNNQTGFAGSILPQPLVVQVLTPDSSGLMTNAPVTFSVIGGGSLSSVSTNNQSSITLRTDGYGFAQVSYQLPTNSSSTNQITVTAGSAPALYFYEAINSTNVPAVNLQISGGTVAPATINFSSTITSPSSVTNVSYYEGTTLLGSSTVTPYGLTLSNVTAGIHIYSSIAQNAAGYTGATNVNYAVSIPPRAWASSQFTNIYGNNVTLSGTNFILYANTNYVDSIDQLQGIGLPSTNVFSTKPWFQQITLPAISEIYFSFTNGFYYNYILNSAPLAAFGSSAGGSPLYTNKTYTFAFCEGGLPMSGYTNFVVNTNQSSNSYNASDFQILVYDASKFTNGATGVQPIATNYFSVPHQGDSNWASFQSGGYIFTNTYTTNGATLTTTVAYNVQGSGSGTNFGPATNFGGTAPISAVSPFIMTHSASGTNNYYIVNFRGVGYIQGLISNSFNAEQYPLTVTNMANFYNVNAPNFNGATYNYGYTLDFTNRPPTVSTVLSIPSFQGIPLPAAYAGMSLDELLKISTPVTNQFSTSDIVNPNFTNLDNSPELRTNPVLDKFISDMGSNPIILANFVMNQIHLCDGISYNDSGAVSDTSINEGGFNRSAEATFLEREGNPAEQCSLLIYFLRRCGVPCAYVFPNPDTLQMLDARMSSLLHFQISEMLSNTNNTPQILPVNYPWVAAYDSTSKQWVHLFPWMKDTQITEGEDINNYLPAGYNTGLGWVQHYINADTNIMNLNSNNPTDDTVRTLYPLYVAKQLAQYGMTTNDVGVAIIDRPHNYTSWSNFPQPWALVTNSSYPNILTETNLITSLGSTNVLPGLGSSTNAAVSNLFDTLQVTLVRNGTNTATLLDTGVLRMVDLHNRLFFINTADATNNSNSMSFYMEPLDDGTTNAGTFSNQTTIHNAQLISTNLLASDNANLGLNITYTRHLQLTNSNLGGSFLGVGESQSIPFSNRPLIKGNAAVLCLDYGRVTQQMLNVTAQKFWTAQQSGSVTTNIAIGTQLQLMGMNYFKHVSELRDTLEPLHKVVIPSFFGVGLAKLSPQLTNGSVLPNGGAVNLLYPAVDMLTYAAVLVGNASIMPNSGLSPVAVISDFDTLAIAGDSAEEHTVLNNFYQMTNSASTVHLLQLAAKSTNGNGIIALTSQNINNLSTNLYSFNGTNSSLQTWASNAGLWGAISNALSTYSATNTGASPYSPFNIVYLTPTPQVCANNTYTGMGALILNWAGDRTASALITGNQAYPINGGYGGRLAATDTTIAVQNYFASINLDSSGNASYTQYIPSDSFPTTTLNGDSSVQSIATGLAELATAPNNTTVSAIASPDYFSTLQSYNSFTASPVSLTYSGSTTAQLASSLASSGFSGNVSYFGNWVGQFAQSVADPVNVLSGDFYINDADLTLPGPMPIKFTRNYDSFNLANNEFGYGWKMGYFAYITTATNLPLKYAAEMDGSVIAYSQSGTNSNIWVPTPANNPTLANQHGDAAGSIYNLFNNKMVITTYAGNTNYTIFGADGSVRKFAVTQYPIGSGTNTITRQRPYLQTWTDPQGNNLSFSFGSNTNNTDYGFLNRISANNGNFLQLDYDTHGHITQANAADGRILTYGYDSYGDLISVTRPDNSMIGYTYLHTNGTGTNTAVYSTHLLTQENKPEGRQLVNTYNNATNRQVMSQMSTVGANGSLVNNATFAYSGNSTNGTTTLTDALQHVTTYTYAGGQITQVNYPNGSSSSMTWYTNATSSGAYPRSLATRVDKRGLTTTYSYDASGNLTNTTTTGNITGSSSSSAVKAIKYNSLNLPTQITEPNGNTETFAYGSSISPYLVTQDNHYAASGGLVKGTATTYVNSGSTSVYAKGLPGTVTQTGIGATSVVSYTYDNQGHPVIERHTTGTGDPAVTYSQAYNLRNELVSKTDAAGQRTSYAYDDLGHQIWQQIADFKGNTVDWHYNYYNENGEIEWSQGARYNPTDYSETIYDQAGRVSQTLVWNSQATGGGVTSGSVATTTYTHDAFGNLTQIVDPIGTTTVMTYDAIGQMLTRKKTAASGGTVSTEGFAYTPGGDVSTYTNVLGGVTTTSYTQTGLPITHSNPDGTSQSLTYLVDGRPSVITLPNASTQNLSYNDSTGTVTSVLTSGTGNITTSQTIDFRGNVISSTDGAGYTHTTTYDALGRPKVESGPAGGSGYAQQTITHSYDAAGLSRTDVNALGETTINSFDAIGRPTEVDKYSTGGGLAHTTSYQYSPDHQAVTMTEGKSASGFVPGSTTVFSDFHGKPVLTIKPDGATIISTYDANENLLSTTDELGHTTTYAYDGLNHLTSQKLPDGAATSFVYDAAGDLLSRAMPGGLTWSAIYNSAAQKTSEKLAGGGSTTRTYSYSYNTSGGGAGQLASMTDPRGIVTTYGYDGFGRATSVAAVDSSTNQLGVTRTYTFDPRNLLTGVTQTYQKATLSPTTQVTRTLDGYGAILAEQTYIGGTLKDTWSLAHDGAGRRSQLTELNNSSLPYAYKYQADGNMVEADFNQGSYYFGYHNDGRLCNRTTPAKVQNITLDPVGRIIASSQSISGTNELSESISWKANSTQASNAISRNGSSSPSDNRGYGYDARNHLTSAGFSPSSGLAGSASYSFDGGSAGGLGLRTAVTLGAGLTGQNTQNYSGLAQLTNETVTGSLASTLGVAGALLGSPISQSYDAAGNVTTRTWASTTDTLTWDAFGQLVQDVRTGTGAFTWNAVYDGLGRRLQTTQGGTTIQSSYDPEVEFLDLATTVNGTRFWKVVGPDISGHYGGMQGTGGIEAVYNGTTATTSFLLSDTYGHAEATLTGSTFIWNPSLSDGYGVLPGSSVATALSGSTANLATVLGWRGKYIDPTGYYYLGARYYAPDSGNFLSPDPLGHAASMDLYSYCNGDPVNQFDPDGRFTLPPGALPTIMCHGMSGLGYSGNPNDFAGLSTIPGSGPNAQQGYQMLEHATVNAAIFLGGAAVTYGGGEYIAGLYEAGSFGSGTLGTTLYVGANAMLGGTTSVAASATTQLANTGQINTGELAVSGSAGFFFGSLSSGASLLRSAIVEKAGTIESQAATLNSVGSYLGYSAEEINSADILAEQTASLTPVQTGAIWTYDTFGAPVLQSQAENKISTLFSAGESSSSTTPNRDPLSAQKATWK